MGTQDRSSRRRGLRAHDNGMVTAELAVTMPAVVLVLLLVLATISAGVTQLRVTDAARVAARQAAIGSNDVVGAAQRAGGPVVVSVESGELTCVAVSRRVPGPLGGLGLTARSRACAYTEPSSAEGMP
ncbi:TadE family type IV pilus minor pilin [Actinomyces qiguomingii]|uniref:TadE family type IV pilus minor pilin n=1 Tax=Actinomyces qiguomingii TaxID=2057800 RepID=UPI001E5E2F49|nr:TadE family type IV pilus minor pilin [Actinomyces qiguomingii]